MILFPVFQFTWNNLALAAAGDPYVLNPELFIVVSECPAYGVDVRVLLDAARGVRDPRVHELARPVLDVWMTEGLVERLGEVALREEFEDQPLGVDGRAPQGQLGERRAAV